MPQWLMRFLDGPIPPLLDALNNVWGALLLLVGSLGYIYSRIRGRCNTETIENWCSLLTSSDEKKRQRAIKNLIACGSRSVAHLVDILHKTDSSTQREQIVEILCEIGPPALKRLLASRRETNVAPLVDNALENYLPQVVRRLQIEQENSPKWVHFQRQVLRTPNQDILSCLVSLLDDPDPIVQEGAAFALGYYELPEIARELGRRLYPTECQNSEIRKAIAESLGQLRLPDAIPYLKIALKDTNRDVRISACSSLGDIGQEDAIWAIRDILLPFEEIEVRIEAARALGKIGGSKAQETLTKASNELADDEENQSLRDVIADELASLQRSSNQSNDEE